jgi:hypothetical protein
MDFAGVIKRHLADNKTTTMSSIISNAIVQKVEMDIAGEVVGIQTDKMASIVAKQFDFCDDIFKHILSFTVSLPTCDVKKCKFVATEVCENCQDEFCKKCMDKDNEDGLCNKCVKRGFARCQICYNDLTNIECDDCGSLYCNECALWNEDGHRTDRCVECPHSSDEE